ncbi:MAG: MBL fold metallo-hydrolase [Gemmatimonadetes bacterium]|nr:MBL fold metallo-hydrolase [Gemmatimonadota bacterium]
MPAPAGRGAAGAVEGRPVLELGDIRVTVLNDGFQRLDGGAMFGVVPKPLWERRIAPDERNRIRLALRCLLLEGPGGPVLVDTGIGSKEQARDSRFCDIYGVEREGGLLAELDALGLAPEDVRLVVNTHLHFDHCGGNTRLGPDGSVVPTFPNARYVVVRGEWQDAMAPSERNRASYLRDNFVPPQQAGLLDLVAPGSVLSPGVQFVHAPGHTRFHQCVRIDGGAGTALFCADLVPTASHIPYPYIMAYDLYPMETLGTKKSLLPEAAGEGWRIVLEHEPENPVGRLQPEERGGFGWVPEA